VVAMKCACCGQIKDDSCFEVIVQGGFDKSVKIDLLNVKVKSLTITNSICNECRVSKSELKLPKPFFTSCVVEPYDEDAEEYFNKLIAGGIRHAKQRFFYTSRLVRIFKGRKKASKKRLAQSRRKSFL